MSEHTVVRIILWTWLAMALALAFAMGTPTSAEATELPPEGDAPYGWCSSDGGLMWEACPEPEPPAPGYCYFGDEWVPCIDLNGDDDGTGEVQEGADDGVCHEDEPCWDCHAMGNLVCGPVTEIGEPASGQAPAAVPTVIEPSFTG